MFKNKKKKGFTLIEILLVVGFIALAGIGVYIVYDKVQTTHNVNQEVRDLNLLKIGIVNLYATSPNYNTLTNQVAINAKIIPDTMIVSGTSIKTKYGAEIVMNPGQFNGNNSVMISYSSIPVAVCSRLITNIATNFDFVLVAGNPIKNTFANPPQPLDVSLTAQFCNQQVTYIPIYFGFKEKR